MDKQLADMTKDELIAQAKETYSVDLSKSMARDDMIQKIEKLAVDSVPLQVHVERTANTVEPMYELMIHEQEGDHGNDDVAVSVNGRAYVIKRGHKVVVPESILHVLNNAVQTVFTRDAGGNLVERSFNRFSFQSKPL